MPLPASVEHGNYRVELYYQGTNMTNGRVRALMATASCTKDVKGMKNETSERDANVTEKKLVSA